MDRDAGAACVERDTHGLEQIWLPAAPRISEGRDLVDVDAEPHHAASLLPEMAECKARTAVAWPGAS
jgi:hypothetical protein